MSIKIDEGAYRTLTLFFLSCRPTVGDLVLERFFSYNGPFPVAFKDILGDLSWVLEWIPGLKENEAPDNVFFKINSYGVEKSEPILKSRDICLFFGNVEHLKTARMSCSVFSDLTIDQRTVAHLVLPLRVSEVYDNAVSGEVIYTSLPIRNIFTSFPDIKVGDVILVHFANVIMSNPPTPLIDYLSNIQQTFLAHELKKISSITYLSTYKETKARAQKFL